MSALFDDFLADFPMTQARPFSQAELEPLKGRVPASVHGLLERAGLASSKEFFFTLAPDEGAPYLEAWGVNPAVAQAFLISAFGLVVFATDSQIGDIDPFSGKGQLWEPAVGFLMLGMNLVHSFEEFEIRALGAKPLSRNEVLAMHPPVKLGGHFGNGGGIVSNIRFEREDRAKHVTYQASLYAHRVKGLPKGLMLTASAKAKAKAKVPVLAKAAPPLAAPSPFKDPALHYAVVSALVDAKTLGVERLHGALAKLCEHTPDEEDAHLRKAVKTLLTIALAPDALASIRRIARTLPVEGVFETILGVETGGEADYMDLRSLAGIEALVGLKELDLGGLLNPNGKPLDLAPLAAHPTLEKLNLGAGRVKGLEALLKVRSLKVVIVPEGFADRALAKLAAQKVTVSRAT